MAREPGRILDSGDPFPSLTLETVKQGRITLPEAFDGRWGVFIVYRAHW